MPEHHLVTGLDRAVPLGPQPAFRSSEIWTQKAFPCFSDLITMVGFAKEVGLPGDEIVYVMLTNPRRSVGMCPSTRRDADRRWTMFFTREELQQFLHERHYSCEGFLHDLINEDWYEALCHEPPEELSYKERDHDPYHD